MKTRMLILDTAALIAALSIIYVSVRVAAGNPLAGLGAEATVTGPAAKALIENLGLDKPLLQGLLSYLASLPSLSLGYSLVYTQPVSRLVLNAAPATLAPILAGAILGLAAYTLTAITGGEKAARAARPLAYTPGFIIATPILLSAWATGLPNPLPSVDPLKASIYAGIAALITTSRLLHVYPPRGHPRYAAIGASVRLERLRAIRATAAPLLEYWAALASRLLERSIFIEPLLAYNGLGLLALNAVLNADIPLALATLSTIAAASYTILLAADSIATRLDPRLGDTP